MPAEISMLAAYRCRVDPRSQSGNSQAPEKRFFFEKKNQYSDSLRIRFPLAARRDIDSA